MNYVGVGLRFVAVIIDSIILMIIGYVFAMFTGGTTAGGFSLSGGPALLWFLICLAYYVVMEVQWGGTVGKLVLGMLVVKDDGSKIDWGASVIRNILRIVDVIPGCYLVGAIFVWTSDKKQRLGDRLGKTVVIRR